MSATHSCPAGLRCEVARVPRRPPRAADHRGRRLRPDPVLPGPARHRARGLRLPRRARRQHRRASGSATRSAAGSSCASTSRCRARRPPRSSRAAFGRVAAEFGMEFELWDARAPYRTLIMVSKQLHCLNDLLFRTSTGSLRIEVPAVVSNHPTRPPWRRRTACPSSTCRSPRDQAAGGGAAARAGPRPRRAAGRPGPVHAGAVRRPVPRALRAGHQHPPLVPAELQGAKPLPPGLRPRGQAGRGDRALRDGCSRRGTDHRAGRHPRRPLPPPGRAGRGRRDVEAQVLSGPCGGTPSRACCSAARGRSSSASRTGPARHADATRWVVRAPHPAGRQADQRTEVGRHVGELGNP